MMLKREVEERMGFWLSAALDSPSVCEEMKADIRLWMAYCDPNLSYEVTPEDVEQFRNLVGHSYDFEDARQALVKSGGDFQRARWVLRYQRSKTTMTGAAKDIWVMNSARDRTRLEAVKAHPFLKEHGDTT